MQVENKERNEKLEFPCARSSTVAVFGIRLTSIVNAGFSRRMKQMTLVCFHLFR